MSHWIFPPVIHDLRSGEELASLAQTMWSLESARWTSDAAVTLVLRKYDGSPPIRAQVDCDRRTVAVERQAAVPLAEFERGLEVALA